MYIPAGCRHACIPHLQCSFVINIYYIHRTMWLLQFKQLNKSFMIKIQILKHNYTIFKIHGTPTLTKYLYYIDNKYQLYHFYYWLQIALRIFFYVKPWMIKFLRVTYHRCYTFSGSIRHSWCYISVKLGGSSFMQILLWHSILHDGIR